jgi:tRNA (mo5U34)-methyltransferase
MSIAATLSNDLAKINWFHRIDLGNGITTPGFDDTQTKLSLVHLPADLSGRTVLDVGAWDGFFSFEAERRGASRVVALDGGVWRVDSIGKAGFEFAREALDSRVEDVEMEVDEISPERLGTFDLVLFLGVLYHLPNPFGSFLKVASVAAHQIIIETHVDLMEQDVPAIAFYPFDECAHDPSNWCGPNKAAMEAMLRFAGFKTIKSFPLTPVHYPVKGRDVTQYGRMVFHASR